MSMIIPQTNDQFLYNVILEILKLMCPLRVYFVLKSLNLRIQSHICEDHV